MLWMDLEEMNKTVSSGYKVMSQCSRRFGKPWMYTVNNKGPRIEPCGTPIGTIAWSDWLLLQAVTWHRLETYDSNLPNCTYATLAMKAFHDNDLWSIFGRFLFSLALKSAFSYVWCDWLPLLLFLIYARQAPKRYSKWRTYLPSVKTTFECKKSLSNYYYEGFWNSICNGLVTPFITVPANMFCATRDGRKTHVL